MEGGIMFVRLVDGTIVNVTRIRRLAFDSGRWKLVGLEDREYSGTIADDSDDYANIVRAMETWGLL